ncbi:uncharacterized protein LOC115227551, partial [Octopus sinensis]|uniref:Uncharacterized protein LOC115227551 n=1 Tax=Octopus sinensis TaxID=2607531 RepID=A0A6P7TY60_9MOLL
LSGFRELGTKDTVKLSTSWMRHLGNCFDVINLGCPPQLYGKDCINECHCSRAESCHEITGKCEGGCEDGWYGENCDKRTYVNIAEGKQTYQSSTYGEKGTLVFFNGTCMDRNVGMTSDKAVDGNFDPGVIHKSCALTKIEKDPYWQVTFDKPYKISHLRIYNRMGNRKYCLKCYSRYCCYLVSFRPD